MPIDDRRVTLKDIAEKTGFTVNTVSQALRGSPKLRKETKAAIRAAAKELGYVHNALAGSLRSGSSRTIAIIVGDTSNLRFSIQLHAFELAFRTLGYQVIVMNTDETAQYELDAVKNAVRSSTPSRHGTMLMMRSMLELSLTAPMPNSFATLMTPMPRSSI